MAPLAARLRAWLPPWKGLVASALGWAVVAGVFSRGNGWVTSFMTSMDFGYAAAVLAELSLTLSVAGRGRSTFGPRGAAALRVVLVGAVVFVEGDGWPDGVPWEHLASLGMLLPACELAARWGGPSVIVIPWLLSDCYYFESLALIGIPTVISLAATLLALHRLGLDRRRLALVGIAPWAPSELGVAPAWFVRALAYLFPSALASLGLSGNGVFAVLVLSLAAANILALRYLARRLREAEAYALSRAGAQAS